MSWSERVAELAKSLPNYEPRPQQNLLATSIEDALSNGEVIIGQGGCGVGKSFALTVPMIEHARKVKRPVAISTATKSLQTQYVRTDVPFLQDHLGMDFTATVLKGRGNYLCLAKIKELKPGDVARTVQLKQELEDFPEMTGDLDDLQTPIEPREKQLLTSSSDECPGKKQCPFGDVCFAELAKQKAQAADLVIVNHAALATDLKIKQEGGLGMLPDFAAIGIDESHELENYVTNALGAEFTQRGIQNLANEATNRLGKHAQSQVAELYSATDQLFNHLGGLLPSGRGQENSERTVKFDDRAVLNAEGVLGVMLLAIDQLKSAAENHFVNSDDERMPLKRLKKKINSLAKKLQEVVFTSGDQIVRWVERDEKRGVVLKYAPLHVGDFLDEMIWKRGPAALVSATVAIGDDFSFVAERHGIEHYRQVDAGTPFDFTQQAALLVPPNCDPSDKAAWQTNLRMQSLDLIKAAGGRTLLLFSSKSSMLALHRSIKESLEDLGLTVLIQGEGTVRELSRRFKEDETSVLFGLKSFATGFDVQGDSLRLVIIDKMPFPVPSDVIFAARAEAIDKKKTGWNDGSFMKLSVPMMALDLLQSAGRLIRTTQDEGLIVIFDSRLDTKGYGKKILRALPPARRVQNLHAAKAYLEDLSARRG